MVLRSGYASDDELELTLSVLTGALQLEAGVAISDGKMLALIRIGGEWKLAMPVEFTARAR